METGDTKLIRRYLLGDLPNEMQTRFEDEYFSDAQHFQELEVAENDLIDAYAREGLSDFERQLFRLQYMTSPERCARVDFARALRVVVQRSKKNSIAARVSRVWWPTSLFGDRYLWPRVALLSAGFVIVVAGALLLTTQNRKLRLELQQEEALNADLLKQKAESNQSAAVLATPTSPDSTEVARVDQPHLPGASLTLPPSTLRGGGSQQQPTLIVPVHETSVQFRLLLEKIDPEYKTYDAELQAVDSQELVYPSHRMKPTTHADGFTVVLSVPSRVIHPGDYIVTLYGVRVDLTKNAVASYTFRVERRK